MNRRKFLVTSAGATLAAAAPSTTDVTALYADRATRLEKAKPDGTDLWVRSADLPRINEFEVKPQGACRSDIRIPLSTNLKNGAWFNLTGSARKLSQPLVADTGVWSFGAVPEVPGTY